MPKVSVIMPVFNGENYLGEAINSILDQSFQDFEFIIIEEYGNNETCKNILGQYAEHDSRIKIISNKTQLGIAESLNVGLNHSMGEYIARMDADDISGTERLKIQALFMDIYRDVDICGIVPTILDAPGWIVDYSTDPKIVKSDCMFSVPMRHPTIMIRKETLLNNNISYNPLLKGAEDYDLFLRSSKTMKFTNIREPSLFYYRRSQENASSVNRERDNQIVHSIMKNYYQSEWEIGLNPVQLEGLAFATTWKKGQEDFYTEMLQQINELFCILVDKNKKKKIYDQYALYESICHKWRKIFTHIRNANGGFNKIPAKIKEVYSSSKFYNEA